jgi:hypothetical protein
MKRKIKSTFKISTNIGIVKVDFVTTSKVCDALIMNRDLELDDNLFKFLGTLYDIDY